MSLENQASERQGHKRRPKRPSIQAMIKAAKKAGLEISAIECGDDGVKLVCGQQPARVESEDGELDQRMTQQMGVARIGGGKRR
jgi:hypothetical protein